jgi:hypothetical protein
MSDELENVGAGSEPSGEQPAAEPSQEAPVASDPAEVDPALAEETPAAAPEAEEQPAPEPAVENAGGAAEPTADEPAPLADESRTDFVSGMKPGDDCQCPDGRPGSVHRFDAGLVCIPKG